jgi:hypothetical protein
MLYFLRRDTGSRRPAVQARSRCGGRCAINRPSASACACAQRTTKPFFTRGAYLGRDDENHYYKCFAKIALRATASTASALANSMILGGSGIGAGSSETGAQTPVATH